MSGSGKRKRSGLETVKNSGLNVDIDSIPGPDSPLAPRDAARMIGVTAATLANWRVAGKGPKFIKLGNSRTSAIRYQRSEIERYIEQMTRSSTVDLGPEGR